jgi:hypothetical protein
MELTKENKIEMLRKAKKLIKSGSDKWICNAIRDSFDCWDNEIINYIPEFTIEHFTELARKNKYKIPVKGCENSGGGWWDINNKKIRITMLNLLIKELEKPEPVKVAKLVVTVFVTRVIVPENATFDEIMSATLPRLSEQLITELNENVSDIIDDLEEPYVEPIK